ncbi:MAG: phasin family protein [Actinobacteria bacterium]|nr:phasin family protein [Actinomycetota bacterium]MBU4489736.1 phasin family protein [Actinomycetota bacterium]MCG2794405.1 phasin family protein [Actinomycetes bacterium]
MELSDMPYLLLGALASVRDDSVKTVDDMVGKGKELAEGTVSKAKGIAEDKRLETTIQELVKKGKKESEELVEAVSKVIKDTLDSLGIVTKSDIKEIDNKLTDLEKKITGKPAKKKARKKPARKKPAKKKARKKPAKKA